MRLILVLIALISLTCSPIQARPAVQIMYMAKLLQLIEPNYFYVENLYTHKKEYIIVAGTYFPPHSSHELRTGGISLVLAHYVDAPYPYMTIIKYGQDKYGRVLAEVKGMDNSSCLSYDLIAAGFVKWYYYFDRNDTFAYEMHKWAKYHHSGVWKK